MSFLSRLFGPKKGAKAGLEARLDSLEAEAESARPGYQGTPYNKAGDLALREGDKARAIRYYGLAIDSFLEDAQREAARGVANKIIRVHPKAVRTLCTLTWLDLASQHRATALLHLRDYIEAARDVGEHARAAEQVYGMARLSSQSEFLDAAADALDGLGFDERAGEVRGWVASGGSADAIADAEELAAACVSAAVSSNSGRAGQGSASEPEVIDESASLEGAGEAEGSVSEAAATEGATTEGAATEEGITRAEAAQPAVAPAEEAETVPAAEPRESSAEADPESEGAPETTLRPPDASREAPAQPEETAPAAQAEKTRTFQVPTTSESGGKKNVSGGKKKRNRKRKKKRKG